MTAIESCFRLYSPDAEHSVLGALLQWPEAADRIGALRPEHFYSEAHRLIYAEILRMLAEGKPVDVVTVNEELAMAGKEEATGGLAFLGQLVDSTPGVSGIGSYAELVVNKAVERRLLAAADEIREAVAGVGTSRDKLAVAQAAVMSISEASAPKAPRPIAEVLQEFVDVMQRRAAGEVQGLATGFGNLDAMLSGGLRNGNLIIVAGRPGMGKTALAVQLAFNVARDGNPALVLSMEMTEQELSDRLVACAGNVALDEVLAGNMEAEPGERIMAGIAQLYGAPLIIDDQGGLTLFEVAAKARSVKRKHGLGLLVVDYLQLMQGEGDTRNQEIEGITRGLKALAKELQVPVIALSQLSRKCEERTNRRPMPSDLRESGAIEQDADVIAFVYRDEVYHPDSPDTGTAEIIIGKNRQGRTGMCRLAYLGEKTKFAELDPDWRPVSRESSPTKRSRGFHV